jgi:chromosome segregation ATPase
MLFGSSLLIYLLIGLGVAVAVFLSQNQTRSGERWFNIATALPFWPLYVPILLAREQPIGHRKSTEPISPPLDEMSAAIAQVDSELEAALESLDGWAEDVLAREQGRIHELRHAWTVQSERIREMDRLLAAETKTSDAVDQTASLTSATCERLRRSQQVRQQNIDRLRQVRRRVYEDLMATLAWVRELVSMIHLAKFTGAPASRAEELVAQIAAAVEGLSALTWQEQPSASAADNT